MVRLPRPCTLPFANHTWNAFGRYIPGISVQTEAAQHTASEVWPRLQLADLVWHEICEICGWQATLGFSGEQDIGPCRPCAD